MKHIITISTLLIAAVQGSVFTASAQSFDCANEKTQVETMICNSSLLSALDEEMARMFTSAHDAGNANIIVAEQRSWLQTRALCDGDTSCLEKSYLHRTAELAAETVPLRPGSYIGPFGELILDVTGSEAIGFHIKFSGGNVNYTCGTDPAELRQAGSSLSVFADGKPLLNLTRVGRGLLLPDTGTNRNLKAAWCGSRAPDFVGSFFKYSPNEP
ncbi:hypothetical protein HW561_22535 [Rhodobacteraceae bacterium B1Z28]|uniref:Lysozyme inhibitor LprI N-terminal domain-containing protein n=1 Tax=Ruegeria haliotis TaxID=2747601 RepID=A0ABX2PZQ6_9RHOB|nr:hypothetical protein [Ruegeria haliotis]NVO58562.1 hypothetical protein [Ruegeria haliotis]